jgi:hypothetical protein
MVKRRSSGSFTASIEAVPAGTTGEPPSPSLARPADEPERERSVAVLRERVARGRELLGSDGDTATLQLLTFYELGVTRRRDVLRQG